MLPPAYELKMMFFDVSLTPKNTYPSNKNAISSIRLHLKENFIRGSGIISTFYLDDFYEKKVFLWQPFKYNKANKSMKDKDKMTMLPFSYNGNIVFSFILM